MTFEVCNPRGYNTVYSGKWVSEFPRKIDMEGEVWEHYVARAHWYIFTRIYCVITQTKIHSGLVIRPSSIHDYVGVNKK